jgi:hypothetical protein
MLRLALSSLLIMCASTSPALAQSTGYTPPAGTTGMGVGGPSGLSYGTPAIVPMGRHAPQLRARADQVRVGKVVYSTYGPRIGSIAYADNNVAVVKSAHWALRVPVAAFAVQYDRGLLLDVSPSRFDKLAQTGGAPTSN